MKVTIITVVLNGFDGIAECIESVIAQDYADIEHIIIDGGSTDGTVSIIEQYINNVTYFSSEKDGGMYDALNKGITIATGDLIGTLNADDQLAGDDVISSIVDCMKHHQCDIVYGNLNFIERHNVKKVTRRWRSKPYCFKSLEYG